MALDREFLGKLDREIASLKERIARHQTADSDALLRDLKHLEEIRKKTIEQSTGE